MASLSLSSLRRISLFSNPIASLRKPLYPSRRSPYLLRTKVTMTQESMTIPEEAQSVLVDLTNKLPMQHEQQQQEQLAGDEILPPKKKLHKKRERRRLEREARLKKQEEQQRLLAEAAEREEQQKRVDQGASSAGRPPRSPLVRGGVPNHKRPYLVPSAASGGVPDPWPVYWERMAANPSTRLAQYRPLLLVIDLNGTLLFRANTLTRSKEFVARPHAQQFLAYCLQRFAVLVWSSAAPQNVSAMCRKLVDPVQRQIGQQTSPSPPSAALDRGRGDATENVDGPASSDDNYLLRLRNPVAIWSRKNFGLSNEDFRERVQVYKRLDRIWGNHPFQQATFPQFYPHLHQQQLYAAEQQQQQPLDSTRPPIPLPQHYLQPLQLPGDFAPLGLHGWDQSNTVLLDDSREKARQEPCNLVCLPEFEGADHPEANVLPQVHDYLNELACQSNVSHYIQEHPFRARDRYSLPSAF